MKRKGVILLPHLFFPPIWLAKSSFMVAYVTPSWISVAPWPGSLAISLVCTNWQPCGRTEAQEGVKIYPLIFKHGNGNSPINGGFDGNIIYKWGNHKWWEFCWTIHDVSHELPSTACPWRIFNLEIQKLQMFIAGNIWKKMQRFSEVSRSKIIQSSSFYRHQCSTLLHLSQGLQAQELGCPTWLGDGFVQQGNLMGRMMIHQWI